jgi:hypothetical protein
MGGQNGIVAVHSGGACMIKGKESSAKQRCVRTSCPRPEPASVCNLIYLPLMARAQSSLLNTHAGHRCQRRHAVLASASVCLELEIRKQTARHATLDCALTIIPGLRVSGSRAT